MNTGDEPREFRVWEVASGLNLLTIRSSEGFVSINSEIVAISPDNRWLAVGTSRMEAGKKIGTVAMWDLPSAIAAKAAVGGNERPVKDQAEVTKPAVRTEERPPVDQESAKPFESRSFGPGATETLIKTGDASETKVGSVSRTDTSFSFSMKTIYEIALYLDEAGARQAFVPFKGQTLDEMLKADDIHRAVIEGEFPKAVVMSFPQKISSLDIRASLNDSIALSSAYETPEARRFVNYFKGNFKEGDEVVIRFLDDRVLTTVAKKPQAEIRSQSFSRALLGIWVGKKKQSGNRGGLLSQIGPLLK
jgi:hypothetical protein